MTLSDSAIRELKEILLQDNIVLTDLELQKFGTFLLTIGVLSLKLNK